MILEKVEGAMTQLEKYNRRKTNAPTGLKRFWKHLKKMKF